MLMFISRLIDKQDLGKFISDEYEKILLNIVFPLLVEMTPYDNLLKENNDNQDFYVNNINDLITNQNSKTIRCVSAYILLVISSQHEDSVGFILKTVSDSFYCLFNNLEYQASVNCNKNDTNTALAFNNLKQIEKIEVLLLVLSVLKFEILEKEEFTEIIYRILSSDDFFKVIVNNTDVLLQARVITLFKNYLHVFIEKSKNQRASLDYIYNIMKIIYLHINSTNISIAFLASDCLSEYYSNKTFLSCEYFKQITIENTRNIIINLNSIKSYLIYDNLYDIVNNFPLESENLKFLFDHICQTIKSEIQNVTRVCFKKDSFSDKKQEQVNTKLIKCFNILRLICEKEVYVLNNLSFFEDKLSPIVVELKSSSKVEFDEDIILIMTSLIKITKRVPSVCSLVFGNIPSYIRKVGGLTPDIAELMNNLIIYGDKDLFINVNNESIPFFDMLVKLIKKGFNDSISKYQYSNLQGSLLIQSLITSNMSVPNKYFNSLLNMTIQKAQRTVEENMMEEDGKMRLKFIVDSDLFNFISLVTSIYSSFIYYPSQIFEILLSKNLFSELFIWTNRILDKKFFPSLQLRLIIIGICSWMKNSQLIRIYLDSLHSLLEICVISLKKQKKLEEQALDYKLSLVPDGHNESNKLKKEDSSEESDLEDESDDNESLEIIAKTLNPNKKEKKDVGLVLKSVKYQEIIEIIDRNVNVLKNMDEFLIFNQSFSYLLSSDLSQVTSCWIEKIKNESMYDSMYKFFNLCLKMRRVKINSELFSIMIPRRIVNVKRGGINNNK